MASDDIPTLFRTAMEAARRGNLFVAREALHRITARDPNNETAWMWLATVAETDEERLQSLRRVLALNPRNERARRALQDLEQPSPRMSADFDRAALLGKPRRRRRLPRWAFWTLALIAVVLLGSGLALLYLDTRGDDDAVLSPTPPLPTDQTPTQPAVASVPASVSPTPAVAELHTPPPRETFPPTWTPTATWTPSPTPLPSPTPPPLSDYLLLVSGLRGGSWGLYTLRADGSDEQAIAVTLPSDTSPALALVGVLDAAYSPDGKQIAFTGRLAQSRLEGDTLVSDEFEELLVAPSTGGEARRLTTFSAPRVADAAWSPDGQTIACATNPHGDFDIVLVSVETGGFVTLIPGQSEDREPAWSPDGQWIAFTSDRSGPGGTEIWRVGVDDGSLKQLTDNINSSFSPAWSPDGTTLVFLSDRRATTDLYLMTANGDGERSLLAGDIAADELDPAWSPDGRWIVFGSDRERATFDLFVVRRDGSGLQRVIAGRGDTRYAAWHPGDE